MAHSWKRFSGDDTLRCPGEQARQGTPQRTCAPLNAGLFSDLNLIRAVRHPNDSLGSEDAMNENALREHVKKVLGWGDAHLDWKAALKDFPAKKRGAKPKGAPHSAWELLEHVRIAQWDMLEFSRNPEHVSPEFPSGYWPKSAAPPSNAAWRKSVKDFFHDLSEMQELVTNPGTDLFAAIPGGSGQTILREALLIADHNSYHLGQFVLLRRLLGAWPKS
jgi:hypothetical protein